MSAKHLVAEIRIDVRTGKSLDANKIFAGLAKVSPKNVVYDWDIVPPDPIVTENFLEREIAKLLLKKRVAWPAKGKIDFNINTNQKLYEIVMVFQNHCVCASLKWKVR